MVQVQAGIAEENLRLPGRPQPIRRTLIIPAVVRAPVSPEVDPATLAIDSAWGRRSYSTNV